MAKEKILIIALPGVGDALLATPMIEILRANRPDAEIHTLVMFRATQEMMTNDPLVDVVHHYDFVHGTKSGALAIMMKLRKVGFDTSINIYPQNRREYNAIALMIGAKRRVAIKYLRRDRENLSWLNTDLVTEDDRYHCVEENVRLLEKLGIHSELDEQKLPDLRLHLSPNHEQFAEEWLDGFGLKDHPFLVGIHAGTALFKNHINRRWAPEKFAELAKRLTGELGAKVLLFGGPDDVSANEVIVEKAGDAVLPVQTKTILDSVAVMKRLHLFVSNDSALMHIAGALKLPTVAIFGPTNETYVHPWRTRYTIVQTGIDCRPCFVYSPKPLTCYRVDPAEHYICVRAIEVEQVFDAVRLLSSGSVALPVVQ